MAVKEIIGEAWKKVQEEEQKRGDGVEGLDAVGLQDGAVFGLGENKEDGKGQEYSEQVIQAASITEVLVAPKRASARLASGASGHSLEKAEKRKAWKNLELPSVVDPRAVF
ncbi:hypothetical protein E2562_035547 [Oryza meyeriana var. granulata]|uniref:Uncharacterized protein n=1 Tax=Oryza meyeriana var. granulata TaxID=110450 RepID=A0A6G1DR49_9ORYZ|nr:hypothetical protein E2562_035547 [Oryza meyeriana var. granulata]